MRLKVVAFDLVPMGLVIRLSNQGDWRNGGEPTPSSGSEDSKGRRAVSKSREIGYTRRMREKEEGGAGVLIKITCR